MEKRIIHELTSYLSKSSIESLAREDGFNEPNNFPISEIRRILIEKKMPDKVSASEFAWAIHECGIERLRILESGAKVLSAVLFLYCNRVIETFGNYDEAYYFILLEEAYRRKNLAFYDFLRRIIVWLKDCGNERFLECPEQDFWLYLSGYLVKTLVGAAENEDFNLETLEGLCCDQEFMLNCGTDLDDGVEMWGSFLKKSNLGELSQLYIEEALTPWSERF